MISALPQLALSVLMASPPTASPPTTPLVVQEETETVSGRVTNFVADSGALIDRGSFDGLKTGDRVTFSLRGDDQLGTISEIQQRIALVVPDDATFVPKPGTKVEVVIPVSRFDEEPEESTTKDDASEKPKPAPAVEKEAPAEPVVPAEPIVEEPSEPERPPIETVNARVTRFLEGTGVVIDRGALDGLRDGDRVEFTVRGGAREFGTIVGLEGRVAIVRLQSDAFKPEPGTPAAIEINTKRFEEEKKPSPGAAAGGTVGSIGPEGSSNPDSSWNFADEEWSQDMPLLAQVDAVDPVDRPSRWNGRVYASFDQIFDTDEDRSDTFARTGIALFGDNPFGRGGRLHFDGEFNYRQYSTPEVYDDEEDDFKFRLDRLSYTVGGTRFTPSRWQFGRFLQYGMPEFGVLDGAEWSSRLSGGDTFGVSLGFMPEPDPDQQTGDDLQVAAWYRWVADVRELLSITAGFQKTWNSGDEDRDLLVAKIEYVPDNAWNLFANAWIDFYDDEEYKDDGTDLTFAIVDLRRNYGGKGGISIEYRHQEYPDLLRNEYSPVDPFQLEQAFVDRLGVSAWRWVAGTADRRGKRLYGRVGAWEDEEDTGGDGEIGVEIQGLFSERGRLDVATFAASGKFSSLIG
ncbi:MAG: hypothetical protein AAF726_18820, partial [Planctomycetota bacterium]